MRIESISTISQRDSRTTLDKDKKPDRLIQESENPRLVVAEDSSIRDMLEAAFSKAVGDYRKGDIQFNLDTFHQYAETKYATGKNETAVVGKEWVGGLEDVSGISNETLMANDFEYRQNLEKISKIKELVKGNESGAGFGSMNLIELKARIKTAGFTRPAEDRVGREETKHFKPKRNEVLAKVDIPGVLEIDWIAGSSKRIMPKSRLSLIEAVIAQSELKSKALPNHRFSPSGSSVIAEPALVVFDEYFPDQTFVKTLTIKNGSKFARRFRVTFNPPGEYPPFFKLDIQKTPTPKDGLIAPGLSCVYDVSFTPNSLANTSAELIITSENGDCLYVPVVAARERPLLSIPAILDIGYCMEGREILFKKALRNEGGDGRFALMKSNVPLGAFEIFKEIGTSKTIESKATTVSSFTISPSFVSMSKGDTTDLELRYCPAAIKRTSATVHSRRDAQVFKYACDNCEVVEFQVIAIVQEPRVAAVSYTFPITSQVITPKETMVDDIFTVDFGAENFGIVKECLLTIKNPTNLDIPFLWKFVHDLTRSLSRRSCHVKEELGIFKISPSEGTIAPLSEMVFKITFSALTAKVFATSLEMIIPVAASSHQKLDAKRKKIVESPRQIFKMQLVAAALPFLPHLSTHIVNFPDQFQTDQSFTRKINFTNESLSPIQYKWSIVGIDPKQCKVRIFNSQGSVEPQICAFFKFQFFGLLPCIINGILKCETGNGLGPILLIPVTGEILSVPGELAFTQEFINLGLLQLGSIATKTAPLKNSSSVPMGYRLSIFHKNEDQNCFLKIVPSEGVILPGQTETIKFIYVPLWYQQLRATVQVFGTPEVSSGLNQKKLLLSAIDLIATAETPQLIVENPVPLSWTITLRNTRDLPSSFLFLKQSSQGCRTIFTPSKGIVGSRSSIEITVTVNCLKKRDLVEEVNGFKKLDLLLSGSSMNMVEGNGILKLKLQLEIFEPTFSFEVVENEEAMRNATKNTSNSKMASSDANLRFDFGVACPIFVQRTRTLKIKNRSPYPSPFSINVEKYIPTLDNVKGLNDEDHDKNSSLEAALSPRYHVKSNIPQLLQVAMEPRSGFSSKGGQEFVDGLTRFRSLLEAMKRVLSDGRGAAFHAVPSLGVIPAWGEVTIKLNSYNNQVGIYEDWVSCQVAGVHRRLPIRLCVVGTPVKFTGPQLVSRKEYNPNNHMANFDTVNFGSRVIDPKFGPTDGIRLRSFLKAGRTHSGNLIANRRLSNHPFPTGAPTLPVGLTKKVNIENHSPREIRLEWSVYIKHTGEKANDSLDIEDMVRFSQRIDKSETGVIEISPQVMVIQPFKTAILQCTFRNCCLGNFEAVVLADIAYMDGKEAKYGPRRIERDGAMPMEEPVLSQFMDLINIKDLDVIAKLRIRGSCIEPRLSLDIGDTIRIRKDLRTIGEDSREDLNSIHFLTNQSDAVCGFTVKAMPENLFKVQPSKSCLKDAEKGLYELKQKQQMLITVCYRGSAKDAIKRRASLMITSREISLVPSREISLAPSREISITLEGEVLNDSFLKPFSPYSKPVSPLTPRSPVSPRSPMTPSRKARSTTTPAMQLATGYLAILFTNGMSQEIPIVLEGTNE